MHFPKIEAASRSLVSPSLSPDFGGRPGNAMGVRVTEMAGRCQRSVAGCQLPPSTRVRSGLFLGLMTMRLLAGLRADRGGLESNHSAYNQIRELQFEINRGLQPDQQFEPRFSGVYRPEDDYAKFTSGVLPDSSSLKRSYLFGFAGLALFFAGAAVLKLLILG